MPFIVYKGDEENPEQAADIFAKLGHKLVGEVEVVWGVLCCSGYWYELRCETCNQFFSFNPLYTHELNGPPDYDVANPVCLGHR